MRKKIAGTRAVNVYSAASLSSVTVDMLSSIKSFIADQTFDKRPMLI